MSTNVVILGGGFAGVYTAMYLEKLAGRNSDFNITLVNRENYFVFQPMLPEVISGSIEIQHIINPIRRLCRRTNLVVRDVEQIDLENKVVSTSPGFRPQPVRLPYDHLVLGLGTVMNFSRMAGLQEHGFPFKNLGDALHLRNHVIHVLEEADVEKDPEVRRGLLTFVVAGGGFSGVECAAELNDFVREASHSYRNLDPDEVRVVMLHAGDLILPEMPKKLGQFADRLLRKRKVDIRYGVRLAGASANAALLQGGDKIPCKTLVATVPAGPHPLISSLDLPQERGRVLVETTTQVKDTPGVWALGDCAFVPDLVNADKATEERPVIFCPPTAQYAIRQAKTCAHNIMVTEKGGKMKDFRFKALGMAGALGHRAAVADMFGKIQVSGFLGWLIWRGIYWSKLPGLERKFRVGVDWAMDLILPKDIVQIKTGRSQSISQEHYEPGEVIFNEGDVGDRVYAVIEGEVEVLRNGQVLAKLGAGDCFGETALLSDAPRNATVKAASSVDLLSIFRGDFDALMEHVPGMRNIFESLMKQRGGSAPAATAEAAEE